MLHIPVSLIKSFSQTELFDISSETDSEKFDSRRFIEMKKFYEPRHDKTNVMRLRPAWIQTSLRIRAV
jgi:hypothetical protein